MFCSRGSERRISVYLAVLLVLPLRASASFLEMGDAATFNEGLTGPHIEEASTCKGDQSAASQKPPDPSTRPSSFQDTSQEPRGAAAAPETRPDGVPSSNAAGAAIAPVKQKRIRRFSIATALVIGAAVAIGVVVGLSAASPARQ